MIVPVLVEKFVWPVLDWGFAIGAALGHTAQGTLCTIPATPRHMDVREESRDAH